MNIIEQLKLKFTSGNDIPIERSTITADEFSQLLRWAEEKEAECEIAFLPDVDWFASVVCEARNEWHEHHEMNFLEDNGPHPDDYMGSRIAQALRDLYDPECQPKGDE